MPSLDRSMLMAPDLGTLASGGVGLVTATSMFFLSSGSPSDGELGWRPDRSIIWEPFLKKLTHSSFFCFHHPQRIGRADSHLFPFGFLKPILLLGNLFQNGDRLFRPCFSQGFEEINLLLIVPLVKILRQDDLSEGLHCLDLDGPRQGNRGLSSDFRAGSFKNRWMRSLPFSPI